MAAEDYIDDWSPGDEYDGAVHCRCCDQVCEWDVDRNIWYLVDYYTGERHVCKVEFPLDEAQ